MQSNTQVGTHGVGPNWTSTVDGSVVNGAKAYQENSPLSDAIPWLLLRATSNTGTGVFSDVTYVIRANTTGGKAPATGCDATTAGTDTRVGYTADYYFYNGGGPGTAWMTPPANLPAAIAVPSGATLKLHDHAIGVQVYTCTASAAGGAGGGGGAGGAGGSGATTYSWVLKQPDAVLYDSSFAQVGTHGAGAELDLHRRRQRRQRREDRPGELDGDRRGPVAAPASVVDTRARACSATSPTCSG